MTGIDAVAWMGALRHGESAGNVAANRAEAGGADVIDIDTPDHATGLTEAGRAQAMTVGAWFAQLPIAQRPDLIVASPYLRASQTAELVAAPLQGDVRYDERLRDRELGVLDRLTRRGLAASAASESRNQPTQPSESPSGTTRS